MQKNLKIIMTYKSVLENLKNSFQNILDQSFQLETDERKDLFEFIEDALNSNQESNSQNESEESDNHHNSSTKKSHKHENDNDSHDCCGEENCNHMSPEKVKLLEKHEEIIEYIKSKILPPYDLSSQKQIRFPSTSHSFSEYKPNNTIEVDAYLYTDEDIDGWIEEGKMSRWYCNSCNSRDIKWLNMISHTIARPDLFQIFDTIKDNLDCDKIPSVLIDVGSRIGAFIWHAHFTLPSIKNIIGIEIDPFYANIQNEIIKRFNLSTNDQKIEIIQGDALRQEELFNKYNERYIIFLHNVFEWFVQDDSQHQKSWMSLRNLIKKGSILIACPPIEVSLKDAGMKNSKRFIKDWLKELFVIEVPGVDDDDESGFIKFYETK